MKYTLQQQADAVQEEVDNLLQCFADHAGKIEDKKIIIQVAKLKAAVDSLRGTKDE